MSRRFLPFMCVHICLTTCAAGLMTLNGCASVGETRTTIAANTLNSMLAKPAPAWEAPASPSLAGRQEELWIIEKTPTAQRSDHSQRSASNALFAASPDSNQFTPLPLKRTEVRAAIAGCIASVRVKQAFYNPFAAKIEAIYVFPLPESALVDEFLMTVGDRTIRGVIRQRDQAQRLYRAAQAQGYVASLLTQDRADALTHRVANIEPGKQIDIVIQYFHTLPYRDGFFQFMVPIATASKVTVGVDIDAGVKIEQIECAGHAAKIERPDASQARATMTTAQQNANADFVLRYRLAGTDAKARMITAPDVASGGGYFALMLIPPLRITELPRQPVTKALALDPSRIPASALLNPDGFDALSHPAMTDIKIDFGALAVSDIMPERLPDLYVGRPVIVVGRYVGELPAGFAIEGQAAGEIRRLEIPITRAQPPIAARALPAIWARLKIADLSRQASANPTLQVQAQIMELAMRHGLLSDYTAFVAVDSLTRTARDRPTNTPPQAAIDARGAPSQGGAERDGS